MTVLASAAAVPALVSQAAQQTQKTERGVVGYRVHRVFDVHAGPYHRHDDMVFAAVYEDGRLVKMHIVHQSVNGKETDEKTQAQTEQKYEHPAPGDLFERPFDPRYVPDYTYQMSGAREVQFKASVRDAGHGDGTFAVDGSGNVTSVQYTPTAFPPYTSSGTVTDQRGSVLPDYWATTREDQQFRGHYAVFGGGASVEITQTGFTRFGSLQEGLSALAAGHI